MDNQITISVTHDGYHYIPYSYGQINAFEHLWNVNWAKTFFHNYWYYSIYLAIIYSASVHIMDRMMKPQKSINLTWFLVAWNSVLAIFSLAGAIRVGEEFIYVVGNHPLVHSISYMVDPYGPAAFWAFMFAVSKVIELGDTVFLVLRKKHLIFLHWYHHATVLIYVWHSARELVASGRWFIFMNFSIHSLMYTYYAITSAGFHLPRFLSMLITTLQTAQMLIGLAISCSTFYLKMIGMHVEQSFGNLALCFAIYASFALLFINFFRRSYLVHDNIKKEKHN